MQGNTALDSTRRVTLVGCRLICGSDGDVERLAPSWFLFCFFCFFFTTWAQTYSSWAAELRSSWPALRCRWRRCSSTPRCPTLWHEGWWASARAPGWCSGRSTWWDANNMACWEHHTVWQVAKLQPTTELLATFFCCYNQNDSISIVNIFCVNRVVLWLKSYNFWIFSVMLSSNCYYCCEDFAKP